MIQKKPALLLLVIILSSLYMQAQNGINYKAVIKDASNNIVANTTIDVQFSILQGAGQTNVYQETHSPTTDDNGLIIINIGEGSTFDLFSDIDWTGGLHTLNVQIDVGAGYVNLGTTQFKNTPYAMHSATSANTMLLKDTDSDTKIQVEESLDDDLIRMDIAGTEQFRFSRGKIHFGSSGASTIIGQFAGVNDDFSSNENTYIGYFAGNANFTAAGNVAIGRASQEKHTTGNFSTSFGNYSMQKHETGTNNLALGAYALGTSVDGISNSAIGTGALRFNTTGNNNVAIGAFSMYNGTTMATNVAVGTNSGYNATGNANVFIGYNAGYNETGSNKLFIDNSNTSSPLIYGEFDNNLARINGELQTTGNLGVGETSPQASLDVVDQAVIGNLGVGNESTDQGTSLNAGLGFTTTPWVYTNAIEAQGERGTASTLLTIGADGTYGADDEIHLVTSGNSEFKLESNGRIGIGGLTTAATSDIHIRQSQQSITGGAGGITFEESDNALDYWRIYHSGIYLSFNLLADRVAYINTTGAYVVTSDRSLKRNITGLEDVLDNVMQLRPVTYHYKRQTDNDKQALGFIAQDVEPLFPWLVTTGEDGLKGISYAQSGVIAIKAIQEQQLLLNNQKTTIAILQSENEDLRERQTTFENRLQQLETTIQQMKVTDKD